VPGIMTAVAPGERIRVDGRRGTVGRDAADGRW